jgi:hypothetical protein
VLPVPDASAFEPDAVGSEEVADVHWPAQVEAKRLAQAEAKRRPPAKTRAPAPGKHKSPVARKSEKKASTMRRKLLIHEIEPQLSFTAWKFSCCSTLPSYG